MVRGPRGAGFALVDLVVAVIMLGVAVVVLMSLSGNAMTAQASGENLEMAAMLLDGQLNMVLAEGPEKYLSHAGAEVRADPPFEKFRYKIDLSAGSAGEPYSVVATAWWFEGAQERSASVETRIAPRLGDDPDPDRRPEQTVDRLGVSP